MMLAEDPGTNMQCVREATNSGLIKTSHHSGRYAGGAYTLSAVGVIAAARLITACSTYLTHHLTTLPMMSEEYHYMQKSILD